MRLTVREASYYYDIAKSNFYQWHEKGLKKVEGEDKLTFLKKDIDAFMLTLSKRGRREKDVSTAKIVARYKKGYSLTKLTDTFNLSKQGIINRLKKAGVYKGGRV